MSICGCIAIGSVSQLVGIYRSHPGKRHPVETGIRQRSCAGFVTSICFSRNTHAGQVKPVGLTSGEIKLFLDFILNRQRNILKRAGIVGFIVAIILFAEHFQGIVSCREVRRYNYAGCTAFTVLRDTAIIKNIAVVVCNHG